MIEIALFVLLLAVFFIEGYLIAKILLGSKFESAKLYFPFYFLIGMGFYTLFLFLVTSLTRFLINPLAYYVIHLLFLSTIGVFWIKNDVNQRKSEINVTFQRVKFYIRKERSYRSSQLYWLVVFGSFLFFVIHAIRIPLSGYDTIAWVDYKAYTIFLTGSYDYIDDVRVEHPLMLPLIHTTLYNFPNSQLLIKFYYIVGGILLCIFTKLYIASVVEEKNYNLSNIAGLLVLSTPELITRIIRSYPAVIYTFYTTVCFTFGLKAIILFKSGDDDAGLVNFKISTLTAMFLPWTKTDGVGYFGIYIIFMAVLAVLLLDKKVIKSMSKIIAYTLPIAVFWTIILKIQYNAESEFVGPLLEILTIEGLTTLDFGLIGIIIFNIFKEELGLRYFGIFQISILSIPIYTVNTSLVHWIIWAMIIFSIYRYFTGKSQEKEKIILKYLLLLKFMVVSLQVLIYYITPYELYYHFRTSLHRLILHFIPTLVILSTILYSIQFSNVQPVTD